MGVVSALFVILLALSGIILQHSPALGLDNRFLGPGLLSGLYGIEAPDITLSYGADGHHVSLIGDAIYFNADRVPGNYAGLAGMAAADFGYLVATDQELLLLTATGELIEVLDSAVGVPDGIAALGTDGAGQSYLRQAGRVLRVDVDALTWSPAAAAAPIDWNARADLPPALSAQVGDDYARSLLSWERLLLDLHSGRILGGIGVVLVDLMALLFLLMAVTGVWIWTRRRSS